MSLKQKNRINAVPLVPKSEKESIINLVGDKMRFSDRLGINKPKQLLQIETIDDALRNHLPKV